MIKRRADRRVADSTIERSAAGKKKERKVSAAAFSALIDFLRIAGLFSFGDLK